MNAQFKKGILELCVLKILTNRDYYGYELVQEISKSIKITEGTIYPLLKRLRDNKFLSTYLKESVEGPSRKYYKLTKTGQKEFDKMIIEWNEFSKEINKFLNGENKNE